MRRYLVSIAWLQSHVIRAPLARIMGLVDVLQDGPTIPDPLRELLGYVRTSADELDEVIHDIVKKTTLLEDEDPEIEV